MLFFPLVFCLTKESRSRSTARALLFGSGSKQRKMNDLASNDRDSGISGCILNIPTWKKKRTLLNWVKYKEQFLINLNAYLKHSSLRFSQFMKRRLPCGHFYDCTSQRPDVSWGPIPSGALINDFRSHVLKGPWKTERHYQ